MYIKNVSLQYFRNYEKLEMELSPNLNILYGNNAQGKTNILEAIYISAMGRSQRTSREREIIKLDRDDAHIQVFAVNDDEQYPNRIDVHLKKDGKKGIALNGITVKKLGDLLGQIYVIIFSPEDLQLIKSGPSERRRFIDMEMCQLSKVYYYDLQQYHKVLKQRNNLLKNIQKNSNIKDTLFVWDCQLVTYAKKLISEREIFIEKISKIAADIHNNITGGIEKLEIKYVPNVSKDDIEVKLKNHIDRDIFMGSTSVGPHKDDLNFFINDIDVKAYGSQGQQRTTALSAKLAEIELIKEEKLINPILLLDDVLSELDENRQTYLLNNISNIQTILTCTGIEDSIKKYTDKAKIYSVKQGKIYKHTFDKI